MKRTRHDDSYTSTKRARKQPVRRYGITPKGQQALSRMQARQVASIAKRAIVNEAEAKHLDGHQAFVEINFAGSTTYDLSVIAQGDGENERVGNDIKPKYLALRYQVKAQQGTVQNDTEVRVLLFQWHPNSAQAGDPSTGVMLENGNNPFAYYKTNQTKQFTILHDGKYVVNAERASPSWLYLQDVTIPGQKMRKIHYNDATTTTGENHIYLMFIHNYGGVDVEPPEIAYDCRLRYTDL